MNSKPSMRDATARRNDTATAYIRHAFRPADRLAVVVINKVTGSVVQRLGTVQRITQTDFLAWLRKQNESGCEIYVSMNSLKEGAEGRTKKDIAAIRHIYFDFDSDGTAAVTAIKARKDLPPPSYLLNTSPDKFQVIWNVEGFGLEDAENLQRGLARQTGADIAATDAARVLRIPGFENHKYAEPFLVTVEQLSVEAHTPQDFPTLAKEERSWPGENDAPTRATHSPRIPSQSERDWAFARRALARGEPEHLVIATIASYRRFDKPDPQYYAELTVTKAARSVAQSELRPESNSHDR